MFPGAVIQLVDTDVEQVLPGGIDCAVVDGSVNGMGGVDVLRRLRARGYDGAAVLLVDESAPGYVDETSADRLGARYCSFDGEGLASVAAAITEAIRGQSGDGAATSTAVRALRQTQRLLAAGDLALRLQHSLNNPLAGLLAEAQLLELEPLSPDHRASVERIIELSRRVIDVVRGLDGVGRA